MKINEIIEESKEARIDRLGIANAISLIANIPLGDSYKGIRGALANVKVQGVHLEDLKFLSIPEKLKQIKSSFKGNRRSRRYKRKMKRYQRDRQFRDDYLESLFGIKQVLLKRDVKEFEVLSKDDFVNK